MQQSLQCNTHLCETANYFTIYWFTLSIVSTWCSVCDAQKTKAQSRSSARQYTVIFHVFVKSILIVLSHRPIWCMNSLNIRRCT